MSASDSAGVRVPPPLIYLAGFLCGVAIEIASPTEGPSTLAALGIAALCLIAWFALDGAAMSQFRRAGTEMAPFRPTTALVTDGPYRFSRNPMYLGMGFLYVALALILGLLWPLAFLPVVLVVVDRLLITREERYLEAKFGDAYRRYRSSVRRWI